MGSRGEGKRRWGWWSARNCAVLQAGSRHVCCGVPGAGLPCQGLLTPRGNRATLKPFLTHLCEVNEV